MGAAQSNALSGQALMDLEKVTKLNKEQLEKSFQKFLAQNPSGSIDKENYLKMATSSCGDDSRYMFERIFDTWDTNHDGQVDFKEYITSMSVMMAGNIEEKLKFAFQIYDEDGDSKLTTKEMTKLMRAAFAMADNVVFESRNTPSEGPTAEERVKRFMEAADMNRDGVITWDEFVVACKKDPELLDDLGIEGLKTPEQTPVATEKDL